MFGLRFLVFDICRIFEYVTNILIFSLLSFKYSKWLLRNTMGALQRSPGRFLHFGKIN